MGTTFVFFFFNILIPCIMVVFGYTFAKGGPKRINGLYGYRTPMSMKNRETWDFAHTYCGVIWRKAGLILLVSSFLISVLLMFQTEKWRALAAVTLVTVQTAVLIGSIFPVEKALKANFDRLGNPIDKE